MPSRFRALAVALAVGASGLPACVPPAADYTESEWNKNLRLDPAPAQLTVRFAPGSSRILPGDLARLRATVASAGIVPSDRVVVAVAGPPSLAAARFQTMAASLLPYGIVASPAAFAPAPADAAVIRRERYVVTVPPCPDWSKPAAGAGDFTNTSSSNFGCAAAVNLGLMVATPADLVEARPARSDRCTSRRRGREQLPARQSPTARGRKYRTDRCAGQPDSRRIGRRNERLGSGRRRRAAMIAETAAIAPAAATRPDRAGIVAVVPDQQTLDRIRGIIQDLQIGDELQPEATFEGRCAGCARAPRRASCWSICPIRRPRSSCSRNARKIAGEGAENRGAGDSQRCRPLPRSDRAPALRIILSSRSAARRLPLLSNATGPTGAAAALARTGCRLYWQPRRSRDDDCCGRLRLAPRGAAPSTDDAARPRSAFRHGRA